MIFFSVGLPGRFAELCDALLLGLAERCLGSAALGEFRTLNDIACAVIRTNTAHLVAALRQPVVQLQSEIVQGGRPYIVALGDVYAATTELLQRPGYDVISATREIAGSCAALLALTLAPSAHVLSSRDGEDPAQVAGRIARHFGFDLDARELAAVAASADVRATSGPQPNVSLGGVVTGALEPYVRYFNHGGALEPIVWEPDLFFAGEENGEGSRVPLRGPIDITGRARFLIYGPYINLCPGPWSATVAIGFSAETTGMSFVIEIAAGTQLTYTRVQPAGEQVLETSLNFTIGAAVDQPVEIRVISERAAFEGRIALGYVRLTSRVGQQSEAEQRLIASLRR